jgi:hypothetical protein
LHNGFIDFFLSVVYLEDKPHKGDLMPAINQNLYTQYTKPKNSGGKVIPLSGGKLFVGVFGSDPTLRDSEGNYVNLIPIYYKDINGNEINLPNPVSLNDAGVAAYNGQPVQVETIENLYSVVVVDAGGIKQYQNYRLGSEEVFSEFDSACQEFGLPYSEAGSSIKRLEAGLDLTSVYGLIAADGSLWINNGVSGIVTNVPSPMLGIIEVDGSDVSLIKKRDENRYYPDYNYYIGNIVIGSDSKEYYALKINGPSIGGAIDPTTDLTGSWIAYPVEVTSSEGLTYERFFDGRMSVYGDIYKNNGVIDSQQFIFNIQFSSTPSAIISGLNGFTSIEAKVFAINSTSVSIKCIDQTTNTPSTASGLAGISIKGRWK